MRKQPRYNFSPEDIAKMIHLYRDREWSLSRIAKLFGCQAGTVKFHLNQHGQVTRSNEEGLRLFLERRREERAAEVSKALEELET